MIVAVVAAALAIVAAVADLRRVVMAPVVARLPAVMVLADSVRVAKAARRAVMAMTAVAHHVVLATVTVAPRRSVSG